MLRILRPTALTAFLLGLAAAPLASCGDDADSESVSTNTAASDAGAIGQGTDDSNTDDMSDDDEPDDSVDDDSDDDGIAPDDGTSGSDDSQSAILDASVPSSDSVDASASDDDMVWESEFGDDSVVLPKGVTVSEDEDGAVEFLCGGSVCACSDGVDNDNDGTQDGNDSECTGPFDNDESSFATGISGDNKDGKWQDCFFDGNSGAGDDGCRYHTDCLTGDLPDDHPDCVVTQQCVEYCQPLSPPGCDCFGCCEIQDDDGQLHNIVVGESCSIEQLDDEDACPRCEPATICQNECAECEICLGMTHEDLPDSCTPPQMPPADPPDEGMGGAPGDDDGPGGDAGNPPDDSPPDDAPPDDGMGGSGGDDPDPPPSNTCDNGATACFDNADCAAGQYCSLGCCRSAFRVR